MFIKTLLGKVYHILTNKNTTVKDVKMDLQQNHDVPIDQQHLIHEGRYLEDDKVLTNYNIKEEDTIQLVLRDKPKEEIRRSRKIRHFHLLTNEINPETGKFKIGGRYSGIKPKQAANKAFTNMIKKQTKNLGNCSIDTGIEFTLIETPSNKIYLKRKYIYSYIGKRRKLDNEQCIYLRDKTATPEIVTMTREKINENGAIETEIVTKEVYPPLYEQITVIEDGMKVTKMIPKKVIYNMRNDVKKLRNKQIDLSLCDDLF